MNRTIRKILMAVLALVFVGSAARMIYQTVQYKEGDQTYDEAKDLVQLPDILSLPVPELDGSASSSSGSFSSQDAPVHVDPYADALRNMDFSALREVNHDVLGWILIPGTNLSYPLVQGDDNSYYLNHTWRRGRNSVGAIFLECTNRADLSDFNTIIYGHRMNNRSMFGTLKYYKDQSYWAKHPSLYITDDNGSHKYQIFAAYEVSVEGDTYQTSFSSDAAKQRFLDFCLEQSVIDTGITPTTYDKVITLSTCTGNGHATRWVVQGVLKGEVPPDAEKEPSTKPAPLQEPDVSQPSDLSQPPDQFQDPDTSVSPAEEPPISQDIPRPQEEDTPPWRTQRSDQKPDAIPRRLSHAVI